MNVQVWKWCCVAISAIAFMTGMILGTGRLGHTYAYFSDRETVSMSFQAGTWATPPLSATIDIKPESLRQGDDHYGSDSNGILSDGEDDVITAYIELPKGFDVSAINVASVELTRDGTRHVHAKTYPTTVGDYDKDGITDRLFKFDREKVLDLVGNVRPPITVTFVVSGTVAGKSFAGTDTVVIIDSSRRGPDSGLPATTTPTPTTTPLPLIGLPKQKESIAPLPSVTPVITQTPTLTPTISVSPTATVTPTVTLSPTATHTPTPTPSQTPSPTPTATPTNSPTATRTPTNTPTNSPTPTLSPTPTAATRTTTPTAGSGR